MPIEPGSFSLGAVAGGATGAFIAHLLTKSRDKESRNVKDFNEASKAFRESFATIFQTFSHDKYSVDHIVINTFNNQEIAKAEFVVFLSGKTKVKFEKAWCDYEKYYQELTDSSNYTFNPENNQKALEKLKGFIAVFTEFAKHKS